MENGAIDPPPPSYPVSGCNLSLSLGLKSEMFSLFVYCSKHVSLSRPVLRLPSGAHASVILRFLSDGILIRLVRFNLYYFL